jgi:hypothetical protein
MVTTVPDGTTDAEVDDRTQRRHDLEGGAQGHLLRLWRPPLDVCSGARGAYSGKTRPNWRRCCRRCHCASGGTTR